MRGRQAATIALAIAVTSFTVRLALPIGSEQFHLQLASFPQYVILFALGAAARRRAWLETLTPRLQRRCGIAGALTALALPAILVAGGAFGGDAGGDRFAGGWHWQSAALALAEGVLATCTSLWAIGYFRRHYNRLRPLARRMAPAAYGAFFVHPPVVVGLAFAVHPLPLPAELKFIAVLVAAVSGSFGLAVLANRTGSIARIIGSGPRVGQGLPAARPSEQPASPAGAPPGA